MNKKTTTKNEKLKNFIKSALVYGMITLLTIAASYHLFMASTAEPIASSDATMIEIKIEAVEDFIPGVSPCEYKDQRIINEVCQSVDEFNRPLNAGGTLKQ